MQTTQLDIGSYGVKPGQPLSSYEDECVGSSPLALQGIVVTRIEGDKVLVSDWHITSHFEGEHTLEQFEEAKHNQDFQFTFSLERELKEDERLDGTDLILKEQLRKRLKLIKGRVSIMGVRR
ncbi:MAG: hypothetical protein O7F73_04955 [Gammaproteobacteria bacterium]|nr:hypothetical protein [Gammaproteobacteria bacterium]